MQRCLLSGAAVPFFPFHFSVPFPALPLLKIRFFHLPIEARPRAMASSNRRNPSPRGVHGHMGSCIAGKSRFMKWLCKLFNGSSRRLHRRHQPQLTEEKKILWWSPRKTLDGDSKAEKEELDRAIAVSLAEMVKKRNGYRGREKDEDAARSLQESFGIPHFHPHNPSIPSHILPVGFRVCAGCKREISCGSYLSSMGVFWHPKCFRCHACGHPICETEFSLSGSDSYHKSCYKELHHPRCDVCHQFIPTNMSGLIEYRAHPFWGQKYCPSHEDDQSPRCCSCERMESRSIRYIFLGDGRNLCLECLDSAIMDTDDCQPLYHSIRDFYEGINMKINQQIPMLLVERQALNEAMEGEKDGYRHIPETRGLCLSEEQTVSSILNKPKIGANRILNIGTHPQKLNRICEVTAILVLYGLPRLLTGSILAHELMHGWLRLNGYHNLRPEVEEGICQVLAHMWLESEVMPGTTCAPSPSNPAPTSSFSSWPSSSKKAGNRGTERRLGEFFLHQIAHDTSPAYGEGFRAAYAAVGRYGLHQTLNHIHLTGALPL